MNASGTARLHGIILDGNKGLTRERDVKAESVQGHFMLSI